MQVSQEDARESLAAVKSVSDQTRKVVAASYASGLLILWGLIWVVGFASVHFYPRRAVYIFNTLNVIGFVATVLIFCRWPRKAATKVPASERLFWRICGFWLLLFAYALLWIVLFKPADGMQICTFTCTLAMFGYVVLGLWLGSYFMLWLGLAVTALTFFGHYVLPSYFFLWMSAAGGGALLGTGLYIRVRWR